MSTVTPMMAQYLEIKEAHADALLFYRMGDFYEMFFEDAVNAAEALDIALTKRGKHNGSDIPMCGVPVHAAEGYLLTLIRKGFRVAVCEQMESPAEAKKRGSKSVVRRDVVRLVTPGTLTEDALLEARRHNFLAAYAEVRNEAALAWADISTGAFHVMPLTSVRLSPELARLAPSELIVADGIQDKLNEPVMDLGISLTPIGRASFDSTAAEKRICGLFHVGALDAFGSFGRAEISAMGALIDYLEITQKGKLPLLQTPLKESEDRVVQIDAATRRNLELTRSLSGGRAGSLLSVVDRTVTPGGARLLEQRLSSPSRNLDVIYGRLDAVSFAAEDSLIASDLREALRKTPDLDRALSRLSLDRGGPRDLAAIRNGLTQASEIAGLCADQDLPVLLATALQNLVGFDDLLKLLDDALVAEPPLLARHGGFIAPGHDTELDEARTLRDEGRGLIAGLQAQYSDQTGIGALKVKHNNVLGYFIEVTATNADRLMSGDLAETFRHRQTLASAMRFTTVELSELDAKVARAGEGATAREKELFEALVAQVTEIAELAPIARALAGLDVAAALAEAAQAHAWARPRIDKSLAFKVDAGRHPVVEAALKAQGAGGFVPNDCDLTADAAPAEAEGEESSTSRPVWLLTGPNMAGKSTFLRQNALIAVMAQAGSYVPASSAHIGVVDHLFSRVGASDDLARGRSTFMVEMVETAAILNRATDRSLVILDEIGRGTATYDGLSIAWATLEHLHEVNRARTLFATHYHELTGLTATLPRLANATMRVAEHGEDVVFLHEVAPGAADRSYGIHVARLAGLPAQALTRAEEVLKALEEGDTAAGTRQDLAQDLPLFAAAPRPRSSGHTAAAPDPVRQTLADANPDDMTPREALDFLYQLRRKLGDA